MRKSPALPLADLQADLVGLTPGELSAWREVLTLTWPIYKAVTIELARSIQAPQERPGAPKRVTSGEIVP